MSAPRLRRDPRVTEKGARKRARIALRKIIEGEAFNIHVKKLDKSWGERRGHWVAWIDLCCEDEAGMMGHSPHSAGAAVRNLGTNLERALLVATEHPVYFEEHGYLEPGWMYSDESWGLARGITERNRKKGIR